MSLIVSFAAPLFWGAQLMTTGNILPPANPILSSTDPTISTLIAVIKDAQEINARISNTPYCSAATIAPPPISTQPVTVRINENGAISASVPAGNIPFNHTAASTVKALTMFRVFQDVLGGKTENLDNPVPPEVIAAAKALGSSFFNDNKAATWGDLIKHTWETSDNGLAEVIAAYQPNKPLPESFENIATQAGHNLQGFFLRNTTIELSKVLIFNGSGHPDGVEGGSGPYPVARISELCLNAQTGKRLPSRQGHVDVAEYTKALWQIANTPTGKAFVQWLTNHGVKSPSLAKAQGAAKSGTDNSTTGGVFFVPQNGGVSVTVQLGRGGYTPQETPYSVGTVSPVEQKGDFNGVPAFLDISGQVTSITPSVMPQQIQILVRSEDHSK
jgi:hypothetical protein